MGRFVSTVILRAKLVRLPIPLLVHLATQQLISIPICVSVHVLMLRMPIIQLTSAYPVLLHVVIVSLWLFVYLVWMRLNF